MFKSILVLSLFLIYYFDYPTHTCEPGNPDPQLKLGIYCDHCVKVNTLIPFYQVDVFLESNLLCY